MSLQVNLSCLAQHYQWYKHPANGSRHWLPYSLDHCPIYVSVPLFVTLILPGFSILLAPLLGFWQSNRGSRYWWIVQSHFSDLLRSFFHDLETALQLYVSQWQVRGGHISFQPHQPNPGHSSTATYRGPHRYGSLPQKAVTLWTWPTILVLMIPKAWFPVSTSHFLLGHLSLACKENLKSPHKRLISGNK